MTKKDIVNQGCNPELIEWLCDGMMVEMGKGDFSLRYLSEKAYRLYSFIEGLREVEKDPI